MKEHWVGGLLTYLVTATVYNVYIYIFTICRYSLCRLDVTFRLFVVSEQYFQTVESPKNSFRRTPRSFRRLVSEENRKVVRKVSED